MMSSRGTHRSAFCSSLRAMTRGSQRYAFSMNSFSRRFSSFLPPSRSLLFMRSSHLRVPARSTSATTASSPPPPYRDWRLNP